MPNNQPPGNGPTKFFPEIPPVTKTPPRRAFQKDIMPTATKGRHFGEIITRSGINQGSVSLDNGDQVISQLLISSAEGNRYLMVAERAIYVGSVANANLLPGGSAVDESEWQVIGPFHARVKLDGTLVDGNEQANQVYIRNISAGAGTTIILRSQVRYIVTEGKPGTVA